MASFALTKAAQLKPELRLAQAVSEFEAELSADKKNEFRTERERSCRSPPDIEHVMRLTAEIDRQATRKFGSGGRCFGPRMTNILQSIQQFAALGDIIIGGSQNLIACGVWTLVRMTLLWVTRNSLHVEKLSMLLMTAGRSAPRYQRMALLYSRSKTLQSYLCEYFIVIVRLCQALLKAVKKSMLGQLLSFPSDSELAAYQSDLERWATSIKEEVTLLMGQDINEQVPRFKSLSKFSEAESHRRMLKARMRVLDSCSTYDQQATWKEIRKKGTATLFNQSPKYSQWRAETHSSTLVYSGKLGSGKSVLLANIVDDLHLFAKDSKSLVAYFFCRHDDSVSLSSRTALGSLARQLLRSVPDLTAVEGLLGDTQSTLDIDGLIEMLKRGLTSQQRVYIILDGLDECSRAEKRALIKQLINIQSICTALLCLTFRSDANNVPGLRAAKFKDPVILEIPDDNPDIASFINAELQDCIESGRLTVRDPAIVIEIEDALLAGAQGMFLWVALQIVSLCLATTDAAIRLALKDLPKDLPETFSRIIQRAGGQEELQMRILQVITVAHRPLSSGELREALSVSPGDNVWRPDNLLNDIFSALAYCGGLISVEEEEQTVRLVHHSAKQFLLGGFGPTNTPMFTSEDANGYMAAIIVTYLNYGVFDTQISTTVVPQLNARAAPAKVLRSLDASSTSRLALRLLRSRRQHDYDMGKILADASTQFKSAPVHQFLFYSYAKLFWFHHAPYIPEQEPALAGLLRRVVEIHGNAMLPWNTKLNGPWIQGLEHQNLVFAELCLSMGADVNRQDELTGDTPLSLVAKTGSEPIARLLLKHGASIDSQRKDGMVPLSVAALHGNRTVVALLLEKGAELTSYDQKRRTPLFHAVSLNANTDIVEMILQHGKVRTQEINEPDSLRVPVLSLAVMNGDERTVELLLKYGALCDFPGSSADVRTPIYEASARGYISILDAMVKRGAFIASLESTLLYASSRGRANLVEVLLENGVSPNYRDSNGNFALILAVESPTLFDVRVLRLLLESGADVESFTHGRRTSLMQASKRGILEAVEILLQYGASPDWQDSIGQTALSEAASLGHNSIVKLLLDNGANIYSRDSYGQTPLFKAASRGLDTIVKLLLDRGVLADSNDGVGHTGLIEAATRGHSSVVKLLLARGVPADSKDAFGQTGLIEAIGGRHGLAVQVLLECGVSANSKNSSGSTALIVAASLGSAIIVQLLLDNGAMGDSKEGKAALIEAASRGHDTVVKLLLDNGAMSDPKEGKTALIKASSDGHDTVVKLLLDHGVAVDSKDSAGKTALTLAARSRQRSVVKLLLDRGVEVPLEVPWAASVSGERAIADLLLGKGTVFDPEFFSWSASEISRRFFADYEWSGISDSQAPAIVIQKLLGIGMDPAWTDRQGRSLHFWALQMGITEVATLLTYNGATLNSVDLSG